MALALSYPGVYVQAILQPNPPDAGIPTSTAAFIGRAAMGPVNEPMILNSWGDYQRYFGGLAAGSSISYQVNAFFNNGGGQAIGVRLFHPQLDAPAVRDELEASVAQWVGDAKTAAGKAADAKTAQAAAIASFTGALKGKVGNDAWVLNNLITLTGALTFAESATASDVAGAVGGLADKALPHFTASVSINPLNPVVSALATVTELLALQAGAISDQTDTGKLVAAANSIMSDYSRGPAGPAMGPLKDVIASADDVPDAVEALYTSWDKALAAAIPSIFGAAPSDVRSYVTAYQQGGAGAVAKAVGDDGYIAFKQAYQASLQRNATVATIAAAITATSTNAAAVKTAISAASTVPLALKAGLDAAIKGVDTTLSSYAGGLTGQAAAAAQAVANAVKNLHLTPDTSGQLAVAAGQASVAWLQEAWPDSDNLVLSAANPGAWGNALSAAVNVQGINDAVADRYNADASQLFNLTVAYEDPYGVATIETFNCVTLNPAQANRFLGTILAQQSRLVSYDAPDGATPARPVTGSAGQGSGGRDSDPLDIMTYLGNQDQKTGIYALEKVPIFNILCIPPDDQNGDTDPLIYQTAASYCAEPTRNAMLIIDPPVGWTDKYKAGNVQGISLNDLGSFGVPEGQSSAVYFPRVVAADPLLDGQTRVMPNSGYMAGVWAQTDAEIGVWKAPAGLDAAINGIVGLELTMNDSENGMLNPLGVNCLRTFPIGGSVVWGARTLRGADQLGDEYNYVPVRRTLLFTMDWVLQNTKWAVFQPNDERLWSALRLQVGSFMQDLWKQGALFGTSADKAYFVKCDATTTSPSDIDAGRVNVQIGFAPVRPAEFVVVTVQQIAMSAS